MKTGEMVGRRNTEQRANTAGQAEQLLCSCFTVKGQARAFLGNEAGQPALRGGRETSNDPVLACMQAKSRCHRRCHRLQSCGASWAPPVHGAITCHASCCMPVYVCLSRSMQSVHAVHSPPLKLYRDAELTPLHSMHLPPCGSRLPAKPKWQVSCRSGSGPFITCACFHICCPLLVHIAAHGCTCKPAPLLLLLLIACMPHPARSALLGLGRPCTCAPGKRCTSFLPSSAKQGSEAVLRSQSMRQCRGIGSGFEAAAVAAVLAATFKEQKQVTTITQQQRARGPQQSMYGAPGAPSGPACCAQQLCPPGVIGHTDCAGSVYAVLAGLVKQRQ